MGAAAAFDQPTKGRPARVVGLLDAHRCVTRAQYLPTKFRNFYEKSEEMIVQYSRSYFLLLIGLGITVCMQVSKRVVSPIADEIIGWNRDFHDTFLKTYWQKKPLLIRKAIPSIETALKLTLPDDLLQLACEDDVESRLIVKNERNTYEKTYGPFEEAELLKSGKRNILPLRDWTILVQEVDRHVPAVADIWDTYFNFIPTWRRDDIMISYASSGGGIGGHVDNYDVFLVQGKGKREWSIENQFLTFDQEKSREIPNVDTRLLANFNSHQSWILEPGDMLYLPPRIPHQGISFSFDCTTISLGFRAPTYRSMMTAFMDYVCQNIINEQDIYADPDLLCQDSVSYIPNHVSDSISRKLGDYCIKALNDTAGFNSFLGTYLTTPLRMATRTHRPFFIDTVTKQDEVELVDDELPISVSNPTFKVVTEIKYSNTDMVINDLLSDKIVLRRAEGIKMAYTGEVDNSQVIFINGEAFSLPRNIGNAGALLCDNRLVTGDLVKTMNNFLFLRLLSNLIDEGYYYPVKK